MSTSIPSRNISESETSLPSKKTGRRNSLPSLPRIGRRLSESFSSNSVQALSWLENHTKVHREALLHKWGQILPGGRPRRASETAGWKRPSNPDFLGQGLYGFIPREETRRVRRFSLNILNQTGPFKKKKIPSSNFTQASIPSQLRSRSQTRCGLDQDPIFLGNPRARFDYPVRSDAIQHSSTPILCHNRPQPTRPKRPDEEVDVELASIQHAIYGIPLSVNNRDHVVNAEDEDVHRTTSHAGIVRPRRPTEEIDIELATLQREVYGINSNDVYRKNELTYVGLSIDIDDRGRMVSKRFDQNRRY
ncbi:hypothetical protein CROQUDRAFT_331544 [Cronartium quercuum f. sp. fusiforme G11]|uniref:Uncharacterized protein n=1 Tax=Cronartium quercuum f. sp. fusiforme G11 TaxID=708437 RepID=A0A9P6TG51_9BASI|nr:hypothetical protein CROQUDRAFT_331544 [Cronartium quercuum f. sp. fusiforme G11]